MITKISNENSDKNIFLTTDETAALLRVKKGTIYSWLHYKQIPKDIYRRLGCKVVFIRSKLIDWVLNKYAKLEKRQ